MKNWIFRVYYMDSDGSEDKLGYIVSNFEDFFRFTSILDILNNNGCILTNIELNKI